MIMSLLTPISTILGLKIIYRYFIRETYVFYLVGANIQKQGISLNIESSRLEMCIRFIQAINFALTNLNASVKIE